MLDDIEISLDCVEAIGNAKQYLIRHKIRKLPVNVFELCSRDEIVLIPYSTNQHYLLNEKSIIDRKNLMDKKHTTSITDREGNCSVIFWDDRRPIIDQEWGIAVGIGYIMNGYNGPTEWNANEKKDDIALKDKMENAADIFAMIILGRAPCYMRKEGKS